MLPEDVVAPFATLNGANKTSKRPGFSALADLTSADAEPKRPEPTADAAPMLTSICGEHSVGYEIVYRKFENVEDLRKENEKLGNDNYWTQSKREPHKCIMTIRTINKTSLRICAHHIEPLTKEVSYQGFKSFGSMLNENISRRQVKKGGKFPKDKDKMQYWTLAPYKSGDRCYATTSDQPLCAVHDSFVQKKSIFRLFPSTAVMDAANEAVRMQTTQKKPQREMDQLVYWMPTSRDASNCMAPMYDICLFHIDRMDEAKVIYRHLSADSASRFNSVRPRIVNDKKYDWFMASSLKSGADCTGIGKLEEEDTAMWNDAAKDNYEIDVPDAIVLDSQRTEQEMFNFLESLL